MKTSSNRILYVAWTGLLLAGLHMLFLGSFHDHDHDPSVHISAPHACFLCQASSGVELETETDSGGQVLPRVSILPASEALAPAVPFVLTRTARSPPL